MSWAAPDGPLPMIRDPRVVFDRLFGVLKNGATQAERAERVAEDRSILDWLLSSIARLLGRWGRRTDPRLADYLEHVARDRAADPDHRGAQPHRRVAGPAGGAGGRA